MLNGPLNSFIPHDHWKNWSLYKSYIIYKGGLAPRDDGDGGGDVDGRQSQRDHSPRSRCPPIRGRERKSETIMKTRKQLHSALLHISTGLSNNSSLCRGPAVIETLTFRPAIQLNDPIWNHSESISRMPPQEKNLNTRGIGNLFAINYAAHDMRQL